ncbi:site-specific DNA-methyltransferase [Flavobacteriaceae bacterium Ap0902]|nr:site-specific DNA-methyltransferase [Flavobacteriaceae bacterium Ap0902]
MKIYNHIKTVLEQNDKFCKDGKLFKNVVVEAGLKLDPELLSILLSDETTKNYFFTAVNGIAVFDKIKFQKFVSNKQFLPDSYTAFKNKIGLTANGAYLTDAKEVILDFPYKDCVLEGGQTKEDQKRQEIFWNETLAPDEIDRLFEPKVLTNWKRYDKDGEHKVQNISLDDNLIIKGNNLIALHSLKKVYQGKIKLVFIDPPYNTENDSFRYNDNFNHSSWLTFMKNRLEIAKEFLTEDGLFWVSLSDKEAHYCKVLMDEVFGVENFVADIIWNSTKSVTNTALISDAHTHLLLYCKNINVLKSKRTDFRLTADESKFSNPDNDPRGNWVADPFQVGGERPNQLYEITNPNTGVVYRPNKGSSWKNEKKVFDELLADNRIIFGTTGEAGPQRKRFWYEAKDRGQVTTTLWKDLPTTTNGTQHLKKLFREKVFDNPKPEGLMERIIQLSTDEGDTVLDYHLGSGTTITAAHKMKRKYIGIEQMDYINEVPIPRLLKVINGEDKWGISQNQNWKKGGSFVYFELKSRASNFLQKVKNCRSIAEINQVLKSNEFSDLINYKTDINSLLKYAEEGELSLEDYKENLSVIIDSNSAYIPASELYNGDYNISETDKNLTLKFYNG